ncbi:MAG: PQQ-binding-like beta-propeller repeat protein [Planctomycetes bacterium]|nr:PQQ-binding-like beta-propeller repeat protein [Planctomycetota bacterium]MCW8135837.1 PQQ-binding-like beta-propeller repeat protein [Planctomycetota bacterium]
MKRTPIALARAAAALCAVAATFPVIMHADNTPEAPRQSVTPHARTFDRAAGSIELTLPQTGKPGSAGSSLAVPHAQAKGWSAQAASGNARNPAAHAGKAMAGSGGGSQVYAWDINTGKKSWTVTSPDSGISSLVLSGDSVYFTTWSCTLERIEVSTGRHVFTKWISSTVECAPDVQGDTAFAAYRSRESKDGGYAVSSHSIKDGTQGFKRQVSKPVIHAPVACDNTVAVAGVDGSVVSLDMKTGKELWSRKLGVLSAPVATRRGLLMVSATLPADAGEADAPRKLPEKKPESRPEPAEDGRPHPDRITRTKREVADNGPGRGVTVIENRRLAIVDPSQTPIGGADRELTGPAASNLDYQGARPGVSGSLVVFAYGNTVRAVDLDTGDTRWEWRLETKYSEFCEPAFGDGMVFLADNYGFVTALDTRNGDVVFSYRFRGEQFMAKPAFDSNRLVLTTARGRIVVLPTGVGDSKRGSETARRDEVKAEFAKQLAKSGGTPAVAEAVPQRPRQEARSDGNQSGPLPASGGEEATRREDELPQAEGGTPPYGEEPPTYEEENMTEERWNRIEERKAERAKAQGKQYERKPYKRQ